MQDVPYLKLLGATIVITIVMGVLMTIPDWNGQQASTAADDIDRLLEVMIWLSSFVFTLVMVLLTYALWRWRARPGDESDGEPIHGNTRLEIAWTVIPTVIVLFAAAYSWLVLDDIEARESDRMVIDVYSQQFAWTFEYPEEGITSDELHVPIDTQVEFRLHARDVIHSFWVPEWRIKKDNVPGITTRAIVTPNEPGQFNVVCTELCGLGHATMRAPVVVYSEEDTADYEKWLSEQDKLTEETEEGGQPEESPTS
jgi:cytochrome c oxidase subunit 2